MWYQLGFRRWNLYLQENIHQQRVPIAEVGNSIGLSHSYKLFRNDSQTSYYTNHWHYDIAKWYIQYEDSLKWSLPFQNLLLSYVRYMYIMVLKAILDVKSNF